MALVGLYFLSVLFAFVQAVDLEGHDITDCSKNHAWCNWNLTSGSASEAPTSSGFPTATGSSSTLSSLSIPTTVDTSTSSQDLSTILTSQPTSLGSIVDAVSASCLGRTCVMLEGTSTLTTFVISQMTTVGTDNSSYRASFTTNVTSSPSNSYTARSSSPPFGNGSSSMNNGVTSLSGWLYMLGTGSNRRLTAVTVNGTEASTYSTATALYSVPGPTGTNNASGMPSGNSTIVAGSTTSSPPSMISSNTTTSSPVWTNTTSHAGSNYTANRTIIAPTLTTISSLAGNGTLTYALPWSAWTPTTSISESNLITLGPARQTTSRFSTYLNNSSFAYPSNGISSSSNSSAPAETNKPLSFRETKVLTFADTTVFLPIPADFTSSTTFASLAPNATPDASSVTYEIGSSCYTTASGGRVNGTDSASATICWVHECFDDDCYGFSTQIGPTLNASINTVPQTASPSATPTTTYSNNTQVEATTISSTSYGTSQGYNPSLTSMDGSMTINASYSPTDVGPSSSLNGSTTRPDSNLSIYFSSPPTTSQTLSSSLSPEATSVPLYRPYTAPAVVLSNSSSMMTGPSSGFVTSTTSAMVNDTNQRGRPGDLPK